MARKSRTTPENTIKSTDKVYRTAIYARLSIEDCRDKETESLENQIYIVEQYISERPYLKLCATFSDNGETGTNFNRPSFNKMMDAVRAGEIDCIAVKDLSRFGRSYIETGEYIERIFPFMGIRFVAICDGLDTGAENGSADALIVSLKNLMNDVYAKDISQKIISALHTKQKNGDYIGGLPAYGYKKAEEDYRKLVIDEETAPVVRDIFKWKAEGIGDTIIARRLNELGVSSPMKRHFDKGLMKKSNINRVYVWRDSTISNITKNPLYVGHMVQGKTKQALYNNEKIKIQPANKWVIVENTHEGIVDQALFDKAQQARANNTSNFYKNYDKSKHIQTEVHLFKGMLFCEECGSRLQRIKQKAAVTNCSFVCAIKRINLGTSCGYVSVSESKLHEATLEAIKKNIMLSVNLTALVEKLNKRSAIAKDGVTLKKKISNLEKDIARVTNLKSSLYEAYADKLLTENEYIYSKQKYEQTLIEQKQQLEILHKESFMQSDTLTPKNKWLQAFNRFINEDELSREMVTTLIKKIIVNKDKTYTFVWNFKNEFDAICEYTGGER